MSVRVKVRGYRPELLQGHAVVSFGSYLTTAIGIVFEGPKSIRKGLLAPFYFLLRKFLITSKYF
jgi:hypothetical protein